MDSGFSRDQGGFSTSRQAWALPVRARMESMTGKRAGWTLKVVDRDRQNDDLRVYWRSRTPRERVAEVERLRQHYIEWLGVQHGIGSPGLRGPVQVLERERG
jgi:hypothetical protein